MQNNNSTKKVWIIITLLIIVAGMVFLGVFGLGQSPDYKKSYEVRVSVDQNVNGSGEIVKDAAEKFFSDKGIKIASYATQSMDDGATFVYKIAQKADTDFNTEELKNSVQNALQAKEETKNLVAKADGVYETEVTAYKEVFGVSLALGIASMIAFVYLLLVEKPVAAFSAVLGAIVSALLFISVTSIARIPAYPTFTVSLTFAFTLALVFSTVIVNRFREVMKISGNEKLSIAEIAAKGVKQSAARVIFVAVAVLAAAIPFAASCSLGLVFFALQIVAADVVAIFASLFWTAFFWSVMKKKK